MSSARILRVHDRGILEEQLGEAALMLARGGIVVHPTETLYGLAVDPWNETAVARLTALKGRGAESGYILLVASADEARGLFAPDAPDQWVALAKEFWPGPLTIVLPAGESAPRGALGKGRGIAVRFTADPVAQALVRASGKPLTSTSANLKGAPPVATAGEAALAFGDAVDLVLDAGPRPGGIPSTILDLTFGVPRVLREGAVPRALIDACLSRVRMRGPTGGDRA